MKKLISVTAAKDSDNSKLLDAIDDLKEDFDYFLSGLEKLDRTGIQERDDGLIIAESIQTSLQDAISDIADKLA